MRAVARGALLLCVGQAACGGGQTRADPLDSGWDDTDGRELAAFIAAWKPPAVQPTPFAVAGLADDQTLVGRGRSAWTFTYPFDSRPILAGGVVVGMGGGEVVAVDVQTGAKMWARDGWGYLRGVGDDGRVTVLSAEALNGSHSLVLAVDRQGRTVRQIYERASIGTPTVFDDFAFLPYGRRWVVVFDLIEGREVARVVSRSPVSRSLQLGSELYFGERNRALLFDASIVAARDEGGTATGPSGLDFPGEPLWLLPGDVPRPLAAIRHDSVRYVHRPRRWSALLYQNIVVGLTEDGRVRWLHQNEAPYVGSYAAPDHLVLCDRAGRVEWLTADEGRLVATRAVGRALRTCEVVAESRPATGPPAGPAPPLEQQFRAVLSRADDTHLPLLLELLRRLDRLPSAAATRGLLAVTENRGASRAARRLAEVAEEHLARRSEGLTPAVVDALRTWSERWQPTALPIATLADLARRHRIREAAGPLARGLNHPYALPPRQRAIALALEALATSEHRMAISLFFNRFRCAEGPPPLREAVAAAGRTLRRLGAEGSERRGPCASR
ncbi:MAG: hypothetical protein AAGA56_03845 [Myxococcota bacterium]